MGSVIIAPITEDIIMETPIAIADIVEDSEIQALVIRTTKEIKITREIRIIKAVEDSEVKTALKTEVQIRIRIPLEVSETLEAPIAQDQNHQVVGSEIVQAAAKTQIQTLVQTDNRPVEALDKIIINNDYK